MKKGVITIHQSPHDTRAMCICPTEKVNDFYTNDFSLWNAPKFASGTGGLPEDTIGVVNDQSGNTYREMIVPPHGKPFIPKSYSKGELVKDTSGVVNDQTGSIYKELIIPPNGTPFIPEGRNVILPMQKGTKVIPAEAVKDNKNTSTLGTFQNLSKNMVQEFSAVPKEVNSFVQNVSRPIENLTNNVKDAVERLRAASQGKVKRYAAGGFPEDDWFRASHGEIMGRFDNGQSVVANNQQITNGIAMAVREANQEGNTLMRQEISLLQRQNDLLMGILQKETGISRDDIFNAVRESDVIFYKRTHRGAFEH